MHTAIVWNGAAGSAAGASADELGARVREATGRDVEVLEVSAARDPGACARAALAAGAQVVVAAGGDGTVSAVASALLGTAGCLGVLPLGTANSYAAALGIPPDLEGAVAVLAADPRRRLDVVDVTSTAGQRPMILHCMVGLHADVVGQTSAAAKQRWGVLAYAASALEQLAALAPFAVEITTPAHVVRCRAVAVAAAILAPIKSVLALGPSHLLGDDGQVAVTIVSADSITEAIATGLHLYRSALDGEPATRDNVGSLSASEVTVTTSPAQSVLVDGEPFGETPVKLTTRPRALEVIAPPAPAALGPPVDASLLGLPELEIERVGR